MDYQNAQELFDALSSPFPIEAIEWRVGSTNRDKTKCLPLCYVDARTVMDRFDTICGPDGWQNNYSPGVNSIVCNIGVRMPDGYWCWKADGAGATDIEGEKGMLSDAFKRAAVRWGVARYLYDLRAPWVALKDGKLIDDSAMKELDRLHEEYAQRVGWGDRAGAYAYRLLRRSAEIWIKTPAARDEFRKSNEGMIAQLPVSMRRNLNEFLDRIGKEAA